ncbi:AEC family transporter [Paraclostridium ghonii]|uniref:AEC family transporter n=1 Tax=Paraclostridium ghonii TaxID=29358 RepID=UPI00352634A9
MDFSNIFIQITVLFLLILVGYISSIKGLLNKPTISGLTKLIMTLFLPSMIICAMQMDFNPNLVNDIVSLIIISILMYFTTILIAFLFKFFIKNDTDCGVYQYIIIFSNVGFMGYPVIRAVLGEEAIFFTAIFNLPFNFFVFTVGTYLLNKHNSEYTFSIKSILTPPIIGVLTGLSFFLLRIKLPLPIFNTLNMLGSITTPLSMLVIGGLLANSPIKETFINKKLYMVSLIRLLVVPSVVYLILSLYIKNPILLGVPVVISAMPAASNTAIMAKTYDANDQLASQAVFLTTLISIVTIPLVSIILLS